MDQFDRWRAVCGETLQARFGGGLLEKGCNRSTVTADAYGHTNPGTRHSLASFLPYGYCSPKGQSPMAGYTNLRSAGRTNQGQHRDAQLMMHRGMIININRYLEECDKTWARQLAIYGWLTGCPVGSDFLVAIDQISCSPTAGGLPSIRIAEHRTRVSPKFQWDTFHRAVAIWEITHSDWIFRDKDQEASIAHTEMLDRRSKDLRGESAPHDVWFSQSTRQPAQWGG